MSQNKLLRRLGTTALILATALLAAPVAAMGIGLPSVPKLPSAPRVNTPSLPSPPRVTAPRAPSVPVPNLNSGGGGLGGGGGSGGTAGGGGGGGSGASGGAGSGAPASSFAGAGSSPDGSGARSSAGGNADASAGAGAEGGASGQAASSGGSSEDANFELARRGDGAARKRDTFVRRLGGDLSHLQGCLGGPGCPRAPARDHACRHRRPQHAG